MASRWFYNELSASWRFESFRSHLSLAFDGRCTYRGGVSVIRVFAFVLFGLGLFVQSAAQAAAAPTVEAVEIVHCSEMSGVMMENMTDEDRSQELPCDQMTLDCLIAMGCLAPVAVPDAGNAILTAPRADRDTYLAGDMTGLKGRFLAPESPPPQANLDI